MDFDLDAAAREARDSAREFAEKRLKPGAGAWDEEEALPAAVLAEAGRLGFFGLTVAEAYGGLGLGAVAVSAAM